MCRIVWYVNSGDSTLSKYYITEILDVSPIRLNFEKTKKKILMCFRSADSLDLELIGIKLQLKEDVLSYYFPSYYSFGRKRDARIVLVLSSSTPTF